MFNTSLLRILSILLLCLFLVGCNSDYEKGYKNGYSVGYSDGKDDGYRRGYASGTVAYVKKNGLPSLGLVIVLLSLIATIYYIYKYFKGPTKRAIDKAAETVEEFRQEKITQKELVRKKFSIEEQACIRAHNLANKVFEATIQALSDEKSRTEIEALRQQAEDRIIKMQLEEIAKIAEEYQKSIEDLKATSNLSAKEKSELFREIQEAFGSA